MATMSAQSLRTGLLDRDPGLASSNIRKPGAADSHCWGPYGLLAPGCVRLTGWRAGPAAWNPEGWLPKDWLWPSVSDRADCLVDKARSQGCRGRGRQGRRLRQAMLWPLGLGVPSAFSEARSRTKFPSYWELTCASFR